MKLFCGGVGVNTPDIANASRRIKDTELADCQKNGVEVVEIKVGYDGIAIANAVNAPAFNLNRIDIFKALAKQVPNSTGGLVPNPYKTWKDVNSELPDIKIEVLGPPPTSGTRDAFVEMVMNYGCKSFSWVKNLEKDNEKQFKAICSTIREDGHYIEAGENDNLIVQKLVQNHDALGVFGYSFLEENTDKVKGAIINSVPIAFETISSGKYPISRPLYMYVKKNHMGTVEGIAEFVAEFASDAAWGDSGYLADKGLVPMPAAERQRFGAVAKNMNVLTNVK
jgi:phosphate transport system substrate-binding protein